MKLPVSRDVLVNELETTVVLLQRWVHILKGEAPIEGLDMPGLPGLDYPCSRPELLQESMEQMSRELVICAGRCETLADVLYASR